MLGWFSNRIFLGAAQRRLIRRGVLRAHMPVQNQYRIPLSAIRAWDRDTALYFERILDEAKTPIEEALAIDA